MCRCKLHFVIEPLKNVSCMLLMFKVMFSWMLYCMHESWGSFWKGPYRCEPCEKVIACTAAQPCSHIAYCQWSASLECVYTQGRGDQSIRCRILVSSKCQEQQFLHVFVYWRLGPWACPYMWMTSVWASMNAFVELVYMCVYVCDVWIMEADCWGPELVSGCCWEHERVSEGGRVLVSEPDLQNQCPYKRANDRIRRRANITQPQRAGNNYLIQTHKRHLMYIRWSTKQSHLWNECVHSPPGCWWWQCRSHVDL